MDARRTAVQARPTISWWSPRRLRLSGDAQIGYLFVAPVLVVLAGLLAYPLVSSVWLSFRDQVIGVPVSHFVGLANYRTLVADPVYREAVRNVFVFTIGSVALKLVLGMATATVLNEKLPARNLVRGIVLLPWAIPTVVTVIIWTWMYNDMFGVFNFVLMHLGVFHEPRNWLGDPGTAMPAVIAVDVWRGFPFFSLMLLAGLQTIPGDLYEAARVDGAGPWQRFRHVTLPGIRTITLVVTLLSTVWTFNDFTIIWVLTKGGPGYATTVLSTLTFQKAFFSREISQGIAVSVTLMPLLLVLIIWLVRSVDRQQRQEA